MNPADWALCRGLFKGALPRGIGLDVAGIVDSVGEGVTDIAVGERVVGATDHAGAPVAGASDRALLKHWARVPAGLDLVQAAALPLVMEAAFRSLESFRVAAGQKILIHGAGTMVGFAAVQIALQRGAHVFATAGRTYTERLRALGAKMTAYGDGLADRVLALAGGPVDLALDTAPVRGVLPELVRTVGRASLAGSSRSVVRADRRHGPAGGRQRLGSIGNGLHVIEVLHPGPLGRGWKKRPERGVWPSKW